MTVQKGEHGPAVPRLFLLAFLCALLFALDIAIGSIRIPLRDIPSALFGFDGGGANGTIIRIFRLPKAITALASGAALAVAGLVLQTLFRNPLAGPDSLGVGAGASIGAGLIVVLAGGAGSAFLADIGLIGYSAIALAASLGAMAVLGIVLAISHRIASSVTLLIIGILVGYFAGSILSLLIYFASPEKVQVYLGWTFGSFGGLTWARMPIFLLAIILGYLLLFRSAKPLDALLLGERNAESLGINVRSGRRRVIIAAALLSGSVTAFCGPIAFLGIAAPQAARRLLKSSSHRLLLPGATLAGAALALLADVIAQSAPGGIALPLNPILALIGSPIILSIVLRSSRSEAV